MARAGDLVDLEELDLELEGRVGGLGKSVHRSNVLLGLLVRTITGGNPRAP